MSTSLYNKILTRNEKIKWLISLGLGVVIMLIPTGDFLTEQVRLFFAVTLLGIALLAFELIEGMWIGLYFPTVYLILGIAPISICNQGWVSTTVFVTFGALTLAAALEQCGLLERISLFCIYRSGGSYVGIMFGILLVGLITSILTSCTAYAVMAALVYGVTVTMKLEPSPATAALMFIGAMGTLTIEQIIYYPAGLAILYAGGRTVIPDLQVGYLEQIYYNWPIIAMFFAVTFIYCKMVKIPSVSGAKEIYKGRYEALGKMTNAEKKALFITLLMLIYLLTTKLHGFDMNYAFLVTPWLFFLPGINLADSKTLSKVNYTMLFLTAGFMCIGNTGTYLGISSMVSEVMQPIVSSLGAHASLSVLLFLGFISNFALTPFAIYTAFGAPVSQICFDAGINPMAGLYTLLFAGDMVLMPYEHLTYLLFFSFGMVRMKDFIKLGAIKIFVQFVWYIAIVYPWWALCGFMYL